MGGPTSTRVQFEGHTLDARTRDMIIAARVRCNAPIEITQGCYNAGGVAASAGTHDGGGAVDIRAIGRTAAEREEIVKVLRWVGFAAWLRTPDQGKWPYHVHGIAIGCPDLSRGAAQQVSAYKNSRNGLANNGPDTFTRAYVDWTWERYAKTYPKLLTEDELSAQDVATINAYTKVVCVQIQDHMDQVLNAAKKEIKDYTAACTTSVKDYARQIDNEADILAAVGALATQNAALVKQVTDLTTKVDALPKA